MGGCDNDPKFIAEKAMGLPSPSWCLGLGARSRLRPLAAMRR
jgi:hypothetical protein